MKNFLNPNTSELPPALDKGEAAKKAHDEAVAMGVSPGAVMYSSSDGAVTGAEYTPPPKQAKRTRKRAAKKAPAKKKS